MQRIELRVGEAFSIDDGRIVVTLEEKSGQRARLRVDAPASVSVDRVKPNTDIRARIGLGSKAAT